MRQGPAWRVVTSLATIVVAGVLSSMVSAQAQAYAGPVPPTSFLVAGQFGKNTDVQGETFFTSTMTAVQPAAGVAVLSGSPSEIADFVVDDVIDIDVIRADGSAATSSYDFSGSCNAFGVTDTIDLAPLLSPGNNTITFTFSDRCGGSDGNSDVYLLGNGTYTKGGTTPAPGPPVVCDAGFYPQFTRASVATLSASSAALKNCGYLWKFDDSSACPKDPAKYTGAGKTTYSSFSLSKTTQVTLCARANNAAPGDSATSVTKQVASPVYTYAPKVYLAKNETYYPGSAAKFLQQSTLFEDKPDFDSTKWKRQDPSCADVAALTQPTGKQLTVQKFKTIETYHVTSSNGVQTCERTGNVTTDVGKDNTSDTGWALHMNAGADKLGIKPSTTSQAPVYVVFEPGQYIAYWFFYPYNGYRKQAATGTDLIKEYHEGDWEHVVVNLGGGDVRQGKNQARTVDYYLHGCEVPNSYNIGGTERPAPRDGTHPIVYSALGGHASYANGTGDHLWNVDTCEGGQGLADKTSQGSVWKTWQNVANAKTQPWWGFQGNWGASVPESTNKPGLRLWTQGPTGPSPIKPGPKVN